MSAFDTKQRTYRHRNEIHVVLQLSTCENPVQATVFASLGERASDLLNDARSFIPVRLQSGETMIVAKSQIASIIEAGEKKEEGKNSKIYGEDFSTDEKVEAKTMDKFDAYATLRIAPSASDDEIRTAYKARMKAVHPDSLASLGLDEEISKAAVLASQKVNYAYQKIMRERGSQTDRLV
ncbi:MAG: DnaJ domain-containing protein [Pseudomonadota bacterium]